MIKVKVCGTTNLVDALFCEKCGADALGFIFYKQSKRYIAPSEAGAIIKKLSCFTTTVGVFVNHSINEINEIIKLAGIQVIQLHGDESADFYTELPLPSIKAFRVSSGFDYRSLIIPENLTPLFDSHSNVQYGGTGKSFLFEEIPQDFRSRAIIAGGISLRNLEDVLLLKPYGIDLVSSLESSPGKKDFDKVQEFFNKLNQYQVLL